VIQVRRTRAPSNQRQRVPAILATINIQHWARTKWWTLGEIAQTCRTRYGKWDSEAAISARIRELQHDKRRRGGKGQLWEYRLTL
jgi:hypothetical protein